MTITRLNSFVTKGFIVPEGSELVITRPDGTTIVKRSGDYSGAHYSLAEVVQGSIPNWTMQHTINEPSIETYPELDALVSAVGGAGGSPLFVGGVVRDSAMGLPNKDIDIEVYGMDANTLSTVLSRYGKVDQVGASFGIIKLTTTNGDYDFSLPRRESKQGKGHKGFIVEVDPGMTVEDAASRRDFTINAMSLTPTGELVDPFNGLEDIRNRVLRHTSEKFAEDPLRVLRGMQFASRFNMVMAPETADLAKELKSEYPTLAKERVWGEWEKWATKGQLPSAGLEVLRETTWINLYPELKAIVGIPQDPEWHPEGDVFIHTSLVCNAAAEIAARENLSDRDRTILLFAALCHDLGKPATNIIGDDGRIHSPGHAAVGETPTRSFLASIGAPLDIIENVVPLVKEHMVHVNGSTPKSVRRVALRVSPSNLTMLSYVMEADYSGRPPLPRGLPKEAQDMLDIAHELSLGSTKPVPLVTGKDLLSLAAIGKLPELYKVGGPHFGILLNSLFENQLEGHFSTVDEGIDYLLDMFGTNSKKEDMVNYLRKLTPEQQAKVADFLTERGLGAEDLFKMTPGEIEIL